MALVNLLRNAKHALLVVGCLTSFVAHASESSCAPPPGFVDSPHPLITADTNLVSHTEELDINRPLADVLSAANKPLEKSINSSNSLPGVSGVHMLTQGEFGSPGSRRITCLSDASTLVEESLERETTSHSFKFRYIVWNYTSDKARAVDFGVGQFLYEARDAGRSTHVTWTYSFKLKTQHFPGNLGGLGRYLFRIFFLERDYAAMMRGVLAGYKADAEHIERTK